MVQFEFQQKLCHCIEQVVVRCRNRGRLQRRRWQYKYKLQRRKEQGQHQNQKQNQERGQGQGQGQGSIATELPILSAMSAAPITRQFHRCRLNSKHTLSLIVMLLLLQVIFHLHSSSTMSTFFAFDVGHGDYIIDPDDNADNTDNTLTDANADIGIDAMDGNGDYNYNNSTNSTDSNSTVGEKYILPKWKVRAMFKKIIFDGPVKENLLPSNDVLLSENINVDDDGDDDKYDGMEDANTNSTANTTANTNTSNNTSTRKNNTTYNTTFNHNHNHNQKMVILAGPHNTGTTTIQQALWKWSSFNNTLNYTRPILHNWVWTAPLPIVHAEYAELEDTGWTPALLHYALLEAVRIYVIHIRKNVEATLDEWYPSPQIPVRLSFQKYGPERFLELFQDEVEYHWRRGYNILLGTEAFTNIVTFPEIGVDLLRTFNDKVVPSNIDDSDVTVVILYSKPKVEHFMKQWIYHHKGITFHDWILFGKTNMYSTIDALGMVELIYEHTNWNIALVDVKGVEEGGWYMPNYIACHIMNEITDVAAGGNATGGNAPYCDEQEGLVGFDDEEQDKVPYVEQNWTKDSNIAEEALVEMEQLFSEFDCQYQELIQNITTSQMESESEAESELKNTTNERSRPRPTRSRLKIYSPSGTSETMSFCDLLNANDKDGNKDDYHPTLEKVKIQVEEIVKKYGPLVSTTT